MTCFQTVSVIVLGLSAACDVEFVDVDSDGFAIGCPESDCGGNAAAGNGYSIGELHLFPGQNTGHPNTSGVKLLNFVTPDGATDFTLRVNSGRLRATRGTQVLKGSALIGSRLLIGDDTGTVLVVTIENVASQPTWTTSPTQAQHYVFSYLDDATGDALPVCSDATSLTDPNAWSAVVSRERYSWDTVTVTSSGSNAVGWFNLVCNDNALFKMKMAGYEPNGATQTSRAQREATLKMLVADYCGTGESFTETGTPLAWENAETWSRNADYTSTTVEAYWDQTGALCLDTPRLGMDKRQEIIDACAAVGRSLPSCDPFSGSYEWLTSTPI